MKAIPAEAMEIGYAMTCQRMQKKWQMVPARTNRCQTMCE